ncbi:hypothetical protein ACFPYI_12180 [Halomarina salina]|uniref:Uncharacterized protein n=1 Tax=Halomarina salina TaxID=1872699 RepID=A0ABD5RP38_9EURY|nr:hypothetical protein [Halomarina salina]
MTSFTNTFGTIADVLVISGALTAGFRLYEQTTNRCTTGIGLHITQLQPNETVNDTHRQTFGNLSAAQQAVSRDELPVDESVRAEEPGTFDESSVPSYRTRMNKLYRAR